MNIRMVDAGRVRQHSGVTRVRWRDVKDWFDPTANGSAPDVIVVDTDLATWNRLFELISLRGWRREYHFRDRVQPLPVSAAELFGVETAGWVRSVWVWPDTGLEWIIRPWSVEEIVSDVDLHQIQGQDQLDVFCQFLQTVGAALGKRVEVYSEGTSIDDGHTPLLAYDPAYDQVQFLAGPW